MSVGSVSIGKDLAGNLSNSISPHQLLPSLRKWVKICRKSELKGVKYFDQKLDIFISEMNYCQNTVETGLTLTPWELVGESDQGETYTHCTV